MCLIVFRWQPEAETPLVLLSNRDEFYARPSVPAGFWQDKPWIFGGRDLEKMGSWLGVSTSGRLAAVTNYREPSPQAKERSRGEIVSQFLESDCSAMDHAKALVDAAQHYPGFNALFYDRTSIIYLSNRNEPEFRPLDPGTYGLSNHLLDSPWPKVIRAKAAFAAQLKNTPGARYSNEYLDIMTDKTRAEDHSLPETGVGIETERMLSPIFIESPVYGTRTTSLVQGHANGRFTFVERNYAVNGQEESWIEKTV